MNKNDYFGFEDDGVDFPLYKEDSIFSRKNILLLIISVILFLFLVFAPVKFPNGQQQLIFFLVTFIPFLIFTKCNFGLFFKKISGDDIRLVIVSYILYEVYYLMVCGLFALVNFKTTSYSNNVDITPLILLTNILQVFGEELLKIFIFLLVLYLCYRYTGNRKESIIFATIVTLLFFGLVHVNTYSYNIIQILFFQGLGAIFELFAYLKTKNLALAVLIHILINVSGWFQFLVF